MTVRPRAAQRSGEGRAWAEMSQVPQSSHPGTPAPCTVCGCEDRHDQAIGDPGDSCPRPLTKAPTSGCTR